MRSARVRLSILFVSLTFITATVQAQQENYSDENAIRVLMEKKYTSAFNTNTVEKGVEIMHSILSDKGYVSVLPQSEKPSEAFVENKKHFCERFAKCLRNGPMRMVHKVKKITIIGPIAYEIGESNFVGPDGKSNIEVWLNVFAKQDMGWRLVFATPADDAQKALRQMDAPAKESAK